MQDQAKAQIQTLSITIQDLRKIKENANRYFFNIAKPLDAEGGDFLTLCYLLSIGDMLKINVTLEQERSHQEPIE